MFCDYLSKKLKNHGLIVIKAINEIDGVNKIIHHQPDLVICDYFLKPKNLLDLFKSKKAELSSSSSPVIVVSNRISRDKLLELTQYGVKKVFTKPVKIDLLWNSISELLKTTIKLDETPCIIETRMNQDILFVEVAMGLNTEKIHMLNFRIKELLNLHAIEIPKILLLFSNLELAEQDKPKLRKLFETLVSFTKGRIKWIKVLTQSKEIEQAIQSFWEYSEISVTDNLEKALDDLAQKALKESLFQHSEENSANTKSTLELRFQQDLAFQELSHRFKTQSSELAFALVDDDITVQEILKKILKPTGCQLYIFNDGQSFLQAIPKDIDLLFLDLMMPNVSGFEVLEQLKTLKQRIPVIILSALSEREIVLKAMSFGVSGYITKPINSDDVMRKVFEAIGMQL